MHMQNCKSDHDDNKLLGNSYMWQTQSFATPFQQPTIEKYHPTATASMNLWIYLPIYLSTYLSTYKLGNPNEGLFSIQTCLNFNQQRQGCNLLKALRMKHNQNMSECGSGNGNTIHLFVDPIRLYLRGMFPLKQTAISMLQSIAHPPPHAGFKVTSFIYLPAPGTKSLRWGGWGVPALLVS